MSILAVLNMIGFSNSNVRDDIYGAYRLFGKYRRTEHTIADPEMIWLEMVI